MAVAVVREVLEVEDGHLVLEVVGAVVENMTWLEVGGDKFSLKIIIKSVGDLMLFQILRELPL
jgi:hypothetical protein